MGNNQDSQSLKKRLEEERQKEAREELISWVKMFVIVIVVVFVATRFIIINAKIPSGSMEKTIMTKDRVIGFRFSYWFAEPERGDIILFSYPVNEKQTYIKRVIGLPGETVDIENGYVYINGSDEPLDENYLAEEWIWENDGYHLEVPEGCYFVMGDNRNNSADSRVWAMEALHDGVASTEEEAREYTYVREKQIKAKAIFKYFKGFKVLTKTASYR